MSRLRHRLPLGMALSLAIVACRNERREPQNEPAATTDTSVAASAGETAKAAPPETSSVSDSSRSVNPRAGTKGPGRDTSGTRAPARTDTSPPLARDTVTDVRGMITVVGNAPVSQVQIRDANGVSHTLGGPDLPSLRRVAGLEVALRGTPSPGNELAVRSFTVLSAEGQAALDGVLEHEASTLYLRTASRRVPLGNPPADLHGLVGARVWLTGSPERGPNTFGIITPAR